MKTRYLLRGSAGFIAGATAPSGWTPSRNLAQRWVDIDAALQAARIWLKETGEQLELITVNTVPALSGGETWVS